MTIIAPETADAGRALIRTGGLSSLQSRERGVIARRKRISIKERLNALFNLVSAGPFERFRYKGKELFTKLRVVEKRGDASGHLFRC